METRNNQTVAFTGHRKERILQGSGNDSRILAQIREAVTGVVTELYGQGYKEYYTGMASGFDMTAAEAVLQVRERYEDIKLIAAVPFRKQPLKQIMAEMEVKKKQQKAKKEERRKQRALSSGSEE